MKKHRKMMLKTKIKREHAQTYIFIDVWGAPIALLSIFKKHLGVCAKVDRAPPPLVFPQKGASHTSARAATKQHQI